MTLGTRNPVAPMTVAELARAAGVTPEAVRHYTRIGLLQPRRNVRNAYKLYGPRDLARLIFIRRAKTLGYGLRDIRQIFAAADSGDSPCPLVRDLIRERIESNRGEIEAALALQQRMENALQRWRTLPDHIPTGNSVCYLLEEEIPDLDLAHRPEKTGVA